MPIIELHIQADRKLVDRLCADFNDDKMIESVEIRSMTPLRRDLLDRGAHRQTEILDVIIAFVVNIASAAAYDVVRNRIRKRAEERQARVVNLISTDHAPTEIGTTTGNINQEGDETADSQQRHDP
jgi:hypothetical protein